MSGRAAKAEEILRGVLADPALPLGPLSLSPVPISPPVCSSDRTPRSTSKRGSRMLRRGRGRGARRDSRPPPHDGPPRCSRPSPWRSIGSRALLPGRSPRRARSGCSGSSTSEGGSLRPLSRAGARKPRAGRAWRGRLVRAAELIDEALELARELQLLNHPAPADAHLARALVAIQRGEPEAGAFALHEGHLRASSNGRVQLLWVAHAESRLIDPEGTDAAAAPPVGSPPFPLVRNLPACLSPVSESVRPAAPPSSASRPNGPPSFSRTSSGCCRLATR